MNLRPHWPRPHWLLPLAAMFVTSCDDPPIQLPNAAAGGGPSGVLDGTVAYSGPLPCTENGHVVGAAVLLAFDVNLLPPPEGLGTTAASLATVGGDDLFAGVRGRLTFHADGSRWCPAKSAGGVTVSNTWATGPFAGGVYEIRGFYDHDGNFDPVFSIANLPTKGDIGGGAIDNAAEVLQGGSPVYRQIGLGELDAKTGKRVIPPEGARVSGITVTLALPLPLERPIFHATAVTDMNGKNKDPAHVVIPSDFQFAVFSATDPINTANSIVQYTLTAGVAADEVKKAVKSPFGLPVDSPAPVLVYARQDVNGDGVTDGNDHIPETPDPPQIPALFPVSVFSRLLDHDPAAPAGSPPPRLKSQGTPAVIIQGLTLYQSLLGTIATPQTPTPSPTVIVGIRPSTLCIDPADTSKPATLLISHATDKKGNQLITDANKQNVLDAVGAQFNRKVELVFGCLPEGRYALNLVYETGQAWTVPNEAGVCADAEPENQAKTMCGTRPRLASQDIVLTIGAPTDPSYCRAHPVPEACQFKEPSTQ